MQPPPSRPPAQVPPAYSPPPYPYPYPPYYPPPRTSDGSKVLVVVAIVVIVFVVLPAVVAGALFFLVSGFLSTQPPGAHTMGVSIQTTADGLNWSVRIESTTSGETPETTDLLIRNDLGTLSLPRTPFAAFTPPSWPTYRVLFQDANPGTPSVAPGDSLLISKLAYPSGSVMEISDASGMLTSRSLT